MYTKSNVAGAQILGTVHVVAILIFTAVAIDVVSRGEVLCSAVHAEQAPVTWTDEQKQGAEHFLKSLGLFHLASDATINKKEGAMNAAVLWRESLEKARLVKDDALDVLHPDLRDPFKSYATALEMLVETTGTENEKRQRLEEAETRMSKWAQWFNNHQAEIRLPEELDRPKQFSR